MKVWIITVGVAGVLGLGFGTLSAEKGKVQSVADSAQMRPDRSQVVTNQVMIRGPIEEIRSAAREIVMKGPEGILMTLKVSPEVPGFAGMRKGDQVDVKYMEPVALAIESPNSPVPAVETIALTSTQGASSPVSVRTESDTATIEAIDRQNRTLTLRGTKGQRMMINVGSELRQFDKLQPGDRVLTQYTQPLAFDVQKV